MTELYVAVVGIALLRHGVTVVIQGGARGADTLAQLAARRIGLPCITYEADWDRHGKAAGPIRNQQMLETSAPELVLAFIPESGITKGTRDMVTRARAAGVEVREIVYAQS